MIFLLVTKVPIKKNRPESHGKCPPFGAAQVSKERFAWPRGCSSVLGSGNTVPFEELVSKEG